MSGGFFRGTSADQDTRFSNKQAKLLKSQKFHPELDHLVEMAKVKMDVVKPWIATRVTELLGFEDEVLINFIYGLLDGKEINGKEVQIQLTGFMEKNTGKFMKELWCLLLSAQKNASGVPQQFLDAKEEEIKKKKEEADRITLEIQKKREIEQEKNKKMDSENGIKRSLNDASDNPGSKHLASRNSNAHNGEEKELDERNGSRRKNRPSRSPHSAGRAHSSERSSPRSISKSLSNSRSHSDDRNKSRSMSRSPPRRRSISPDSRYRSPRKRSMSPRRRHSPRRPRSPLRRRSPYTRRGSVSRSLRRSSSPGRRRSPSPVRRRSPSPVRRRSPSPVRRRSPSPVRRRSPSPVWRRSSPLRRKSPSPIRRSPARRRSPHPMRRRSPSPRRRRSPSPFQRRTRRGSPAPRRRSPTPSRWRSPSPRRRSPSPVRRRSPPPRSPKQRRRSPIRSPRQRNRSRSPYRSRSPAYRSRRSLSRDNDTQSNGMGPRRHRGEYASERVPGKRSPVRDTPEREEVELSSQDDKEKGIVSLPPPPPITLRSPQREPRNRADARPKMPVLSPSPQKSLGRSESSPRARKVVSRDDRIRSPSVSPVRETRQRITRADSASPVRGRRDCATHDNSDREENLGRTRRGGGNRSFSPEKEIGNSPRVDNKRISQAGEGHGRTDIVDLRKKDQDRKSEKASVRAERPGSSIQRSSHMMEGVEYGPGMMEGGRATLDRVSDEQTVSKKRSRSDTIEASVQGDKAQPVQKSVKRADCKNRTAVSDSDSEENDKHRSEDLEKRKHKRSSKHQMASDDDDASYGSQMDARREAKRRKKEEKRLRKEEKRRRREERHRKKEERRAGKLKTKSVDTVTPPSDIEKNESDADDVDRDVASRRDSHPSDIEEAETQQKQLEIELRKKALESLRAKKAVNS